MEAKQQSEGMMPDVRHQLHNVVAETPTPPAQRPMATAQPQPSWTPAPISIPKTNEDNGVQSDTGEAWVDDGREETEVDFWAEQDLPPEDEEIPPDDDVPPVPAGQDDENPPPRIPALGVFRRHRGKRLVLPEENKKRATVTPEQRLLLLDTWQRSGLPAGDFASMVGISPFTLRGWKNKFESFGPAGLADKPKGVPKGSRLSEVTKRAILMMKKQHPEWGCERISEMLLRGPALPACPSAVAKYLHESGYVTVNVTTHPHPDKIRFFERAKPNQMWQTDLFTFILKRQNVRVHLVAYMDDNSRFIVSYGLHAMANILVATELQKNA